MSAIDDLKQAFRDYVADGVPASGEYEPLKAAIRIAFDKLGTEIASVGSGLIRYETKSALDEDTGQPDGALAYVWGDGTAENNTVYQSDGGVWSEATWYFDAVAGVVQPLVDAAQQWATSPAEPDPAGSPGVQSARTYAERTGAMLADLGESGLVQVHGESGTWLPVIFDTPSGGGDARVLLSADAATGRLSGDFDIGLGYAREAARYGQVAIWDYGPVLPQIIDADGRVLLGFDTEAGVMVGALAGGGGLIDYKPNVAVAHSGAGELTYAWYDPARAGQALSVHLSATGDMASPDFSATGTADEYGAVKVVVAGLDPATEYSYGIAPAGARAKVMGTIRTRPIGAASYSFVAGSCTVSTLDNVPPTFAAMAAFDPLLFIQLGDYGYPDIVDRDAAKYRINWPAKIYQSQALLRKAALAYVWDDHDYRGNDADGTDAEATEIAGTEYRRLFGSPTLPSTHDAVYHSFVVGRVRFVMSDLRSQRSPNAATDDADKVMMGAEQEGWFQAELLAAKSAGQAIVWVSSVPWCMDTYVGSDKWGGYTTERARLANFIKDNGLAGRMIGISGDIHTLAIYDPDESTDADYATGGGANFAWMNAAPIDNWTMPQGSIADSLCFTTPPYPDEPPGGDGYGPRRQQWGGFAVEDEGGSTITITMTGYALDGAGIAQAVMTHTQTLTVGA